MKFRKKGTELRFLNGHYYLYEVTNKWNPQKKRSQKVTGKLLGKITEKDGFIESEKARLCKQNAISSFDGQGIWIFFPLRAIAGKVLYLVKPKLRIRYFER